MTTRYHLQYTPGTELHARFPRITVTGLDTREEAELLRSECPGARYMEIVEVEDEIPAIHRVTEEVRQLVPLEPRVPTVELRQRETVAGGLRQSVDIDGTWVADIYDNSAADAGVYVVAATDRLRAIHCTDHESVEAAVAAILAAYTARIEPAP